MFRLILNRIVLPLVLLFLISVLSDLLIPEQYAELRPVPSMVFLLVLIYWWLAGIARWFERQMHWKTVANLVTNFAIGLTITGGFLIGSFVLEQYGQFLATPVAILGVVAGAGWFISAIVHMIRPATKAAPAKKQQPAQKARRGAAATAPSKKPSSQPLFTQVGPGKEKGGAQGVAIPSRTGTSRSGASRANDDMAYEFVRQGQEWATRQEYASNYAPFDSNLPTYRKMSLAQQQWYFYWRTQLRQGNLLATDLSYHLVYAYELLNLIGVNSPPEARDRLVTFWHASRAQNPKLDQSLVDWVADFDILQNLSPAPLVWYAHALTAGAKGKNIEPLLLEAWHQQGRDYSALPAPFLYAFAGYATEQNKFYQAYQNELDLDHSLKRGVEVIDGYVQETQQLSLYELHLPAPTQTVVRPPLQGAVHSYPPSPLVVASVRPWSADTTLKDDLKAILRYTENILRTQAAFKTKLRGVNLPPAWATVLDQAFVIVPPKRVVAIDMAGAEALQRESDELRQRLLQNTDEEIPAELTPPAPITPTLTGAQPGGMSPIQRPQDAPDGLLTDLPVIVAIMGSASSETSTLLRSLRANEWQTTPDKLQVASKEEFVNVIFDRTNERAITEVGDALIFIEGDEWVVAEDYRDEIAYLLDHPDFVGELAASAPAPAQDQAAPAEIEHLDTIPAGWEEFVRRMQPLTWATAATVMDGVEVMAKLEALARAHYVTANQLLDQANEIGLDTMGDNLIDVTTTPPQIIEEYAEALTALLLWAKENNQIEGLS